MTASVIDLDEARTARESRELGPARYLTLSEVHSELDLAIDEWLREPVDCYIDEEPERETLPPTAPIDGSWRVVQAVRKRWLPRLETS